MKKRTKFRRTFRKNKETQHPAYIIEKNGDSYDYIGLTHSPTTDNKSNIKLDKNPNPSDDRDSYILPEVKEVKKLGRRYSKWAFSNSDKKKVEKVIKKNKKTRK